jgi:hypothetical protein
MTRRQFLQQFPIVLFMLLFFPKQLFKRSPSVLSPGKPDLRKISEGMKDTVSAICGQGPLPPLTRPVRVTVPLFEIASFPMISIADIKARRFDIEARYSRMAA